MDSPTTSNTDDPGVVQFSQELPDTDDGVITTNRFVTVTFTVDENAEATQTTIDLSQSRVRIAGGFPSPVFATDGVDSLSGFGVSLAMVSLVGVAYLLRRE